ncbi:hypothetical protein MUB04_14745 [Acinetobacter indicus]|uniref:hypothetical protein n=1 Tax=Acinetobacter TaxID=469 RepID=UPI0015D2D5E4|nr:MULTISPECIES: hypothetical protein [Acinetobacter]MCP0917791.1 hypothetical protein [Acinetobacter indicus]
MLNKKQSKCGKNGAVEKHKINGYKMTSMAIWDFNQHANLHTATKPQAFSFRDFLVKEYGTEKQVSSEVKSLFNQAKKIFNIHSIEDAIDYLDSRVGNDLKELFPLLTGKLFLTQDDIDKIKLTLDRNLTEIYSSVPGNKGINECLSLYLRGLYQLNFDTTYEYVYKGLFNIIGSVVPILKGKIIPFDDTLFQDELDYQDRVLFSIILYETIVKIKASANNSRIFKNGFSTELGNILCHNANLFGIAGDHLYYNYVRILLDHRRGCSQSRHVCDSVDHNLFYTLNTKTLEQAAQEHSDIDTGVEFDKYFAQLLEGLCVLKLSASVTGIDNSHQIARQYVYRLYKDFLYIQTLMPKHLPEMQLKALRRSYIDAIYLTLRNVLHEVVFRAVLIENLEIILYEVATHLEDMILEEYGEQNKYAHLIFTMKELGKAVENPIKSAKLNDHFYWFNTPYILTNTTALAAYEVAANAGSLSAKTCLSICYYLDNKNTAANKAKAAAIELELMELNAPILSLGVSFDLNEVLSGKSDLPGITKESVTKYLLKKQEEGDFSRPHMLVHYRNFHKSQIIEALAEKFQSADNIDLYSATSEQSIEYFTVFADKFPFVKNTMMLIEYATETTAIWSMAAESGCVLSAYYLMEDSEKKEISVFPFELEDLINPDQEGFLLNPANWNRYGLNTKQMNYIKDSISLSVINKLYDSCEDAIDLFEKYESYIGEIIKAGKLPNIVQVGIFINLYMCLLHMTYNLIALPFTGNKIRHKDLSETIHKFWLDRSAMDWSVIGHTRLVDLFKTRNVNNMLKRLVSAFADTRKQHQLENILVAPGLATRWADSIVELLPEYDSTVGIVFAQYMQWCTQTIQSACKTENHLDTATTRLWTSWVYSLIFLHSHGYYDVEQQIQKNNMSREAIQSKTVGMNQHKKFVNSIRRLMKNTIPLNECVEEFKHILCRGSVGAAEIYHAMMNTDMPGRKEFFPHNTAYLLRAAASIAQTESVQFISPSTRSVIGPYMMLILLMRNNEGNEETLETREFLLDSLVRYKDAMGLIYNVYSAYHSEDKISSTGHTLEEAVALAREHAIAHRHIIQLLGVKLDDLTIKFPQAKVKFKLSEITPAQWLEAFTYSTDYFNI